MENDFVSEVDRKFFANNLLSNEDWMATSDLSDLMGLDTALPDIDLMISDIPNGLQLPGDAEEATLYPTVTHDDLLNDWSDSSDSGVSGLMGGKSPDPVVKVEPLSPTSSINSDSSDVSVFQIGDSSQLVLNHTDHHPKVLDPQPITSIGTIPSSTYTTVIKQEPLSLLRNGLTPAVPGVKINSILNSKVKIQPKVEASSPQKPVSPASQTQQPLVLTPEEFQRLTDQGVLRFQPPPKQESVLKPQVTMTTSQPLPVSCPSPPLLPQSCLIEDKDDKHVKRQQRMIKNRESASLSRKRKKEYMTSLEQRLAEFSAENEKLRQENNSLKRKLGELHSENDDLKHTFPSAMPPAAKKTCLLTIVILLSLNLGSWSGITLQGNTDMKLNLQQPLVHHGRQLLSVEEARREKWSMEETVDKLHNFILEYGGTGRVEHNGTDFSSMCPTYFNKTESVRLAEQLAGWMYRHEEEKKKVNKKQLKGNKQIRPISTLRKAMRGDVDRLDKRYLRSLEANYQIQVFGGANTGKDFLKSIHRRNDTFYVLSFNEDYYLVPAVYHNKTSRPRMSLMMPAVALNDSMMPPAGHVGMMQIDCEVMNTQLIHVQKSAIPRNAREKFNTTFSDQQKSDYYR